MPTLLKHPKQATAIRQASLVEAALTLASQRSPSDITTGDLAQAVGITQGAVFRHFASKEAIWLAVLDWVADTLMAQLQSAADGAVSDTPAPRDPLAALQAVFIAHVDFVMAYPGVPRVIFQELQHAADTPLKDSVRGLMHRYRLLVTKLLQRAHVQGLLEPAVDLQAAAVLFVGSVQGLVMQSLISGQVDAMAAQAPGVFALFLRGLISKEAP
ncbi:MAG: TetR family transcriptional regulator [Rhodoferax sp.]